MNGNFPGDFECNNFFKGSFALTATIMPPVPGVQDDTMQGISFDS
jgi:hypothetical protein